MRRSLRKEKQYSLLEKTAAAEDVARVLKEQIVYERNATSAAIARITDLSERLAAEERARAAQAEAAAAALKETDALRTTVADVR